MSWGQWFLILRHSDWSLANIAEAYGRDSKEVERLMGSAL
jgi:hypothetical protein